MNKNEKKILRIKANLLKKSLTIVDNLGNFEPEEFYNNEDLKILIEDAKKLKKKSILEIIIFYVKY